MQYRLALRLFVGIIFAFCFLPVASATTVTAQVMDANSALYRNCTGSANFTGQNTVPGAGPYTLNGSPFQTVVPIFCDGAGNFTVSLSDNNVISPTPSQWNFSICTAIGAFPGPVICFNSLITITGATQNVTAALQASATLLPTSGGGGGTPGGTNGQTQFNFGGAFQGTAGELVATAFTGADICAQINDAVSNLPAAGGTILVPGGNYTACAGSGGIGITLNKHVILKGVGSASPSSVSGPTTINLAAGVTGIDITTADKSSVRDLYLLSASSGAGTDDGIRVRAGSVTLRGVTVKHFGRYGINVDGGNSGGSADLWHFEDVEAGNNFSDGFHWSTPCSDNNLGTGIQLNAFVNGGWGYRIDCGQGNQFITTHSTQNVLGGIFVASSNEKFYNTYIETGVGSSFVIDTGLTDIDVTFEQFGQPTTITNPIPTNSANHITYSGVDNFQVQNGLFLGSEPGGVNNKTYMERVDGATGELNLFSYTDAAFLFRYLPTTKWQFNSKVTTTSTGILPGLNVGILTGDPSTLTNGDMWYDTVSNKFRCYENGGSTNCIGGGGSVTHSAGPLTAGQIVIGNGAADITVDPSTSSDGAGNVIGVSFQTSGVNGGFTGVEGTGAALTPGATLDLLYPDSTNHCWHQNNNNVDRGCIPGSSGAGIGSYIGTPVVADFSQASQASFLMRLHNLTADGTTKGGVTIFQANNGDFSIDKNNDTGTTITGDLTFFQDGSLELSGNGDATNGQTSILTILNSSTVDFQMSARTGKTGVTGSPRLIWKGRSSGQAVLKVADAAGTPNDIQLPTTTGTSGQNLQTDGANPQVTSWVTPVKSYNHSGTLQTVSHMVQDSCTLGTDCGVTLASSAVYTNSTSYTCVCDDATAINACRVNQTSGSAFTITGNGTDVIRYVCVGN